MVYYIDPSDNTLLSVVKRRGYQITLKFLNGINIGRLVYITSWSIEQHLNICSEIKAQLLRRDNEN